jgi:short subunit dehydrogenase-like uncharacterized protein
MMTNRYQESVSPPGSGSGARPWLLYGAYGYTGRLLLEEALARGHRPILAGRNRAKLEELREEGARPGGERFELEVRDFPLEPQALARGLEGVGAVLHAAGPFLHTGVPMMEACLEAGAHYLDITGEVPVFEAAFERGERARARGVVLMPGVGMDVVPTDAAAALLARALPEATRLELALQSPGPASVGTLRTVVEGIPGGLLVRRDGALVEAGPGARDFRRQVDFGPEGRGRVGGVRSVAPYTWGDLATAWRTTGVPHITCYMATPRAQVRLLPWVLPILRRLLAVPALRRFALRRVAGAPEGPDAEARAHDRTRVWGRVEDAAGAWAEVVLELPEGYRFTAEAGVRALEAVEEGVAAGRLAPGTLTPAGALGPGWVLELPGVEVVERRGAGGP